MKYINNNTLIIVLASLIMISCGGGGDGDGPDEEIKDPTKASLAFPTNNEECTDGIVINNIDAKIEFDWQSADHTDSYTLTIKNLLTNSISDYNATSDQLEVTLKRGTPYSWYVVSKSNKTTTTSTSDTWKFYLAGEGISNYAPFPAELNSPTNGASVSGATVTLEWTGGDVDNDVKEFEVYLDTNASPSTKVITTSTNTLANHTIIASTTYYWKVVTHDNHGNTSTSEIYSFIVN